MPPVLFLATSSPPQDPSQLFSAIMPVLVILAGIVILAWIILVILRRSVPRGTDGLEGSFSLEQLRRMHEGGKLDDEEFEQARNVILGKFAVGKSDTPGTGSGEESNSDTTAG